MSQTTYTKADLGSPLIGTAFQLYFNNEFEKVETALNSLGTTSDVAFNSVTSDLIGNAGTATALETPRKIAGKDFDGSADIDIASDDLSDASNIVKLDQAIKAFTGTEPTSFAGNVGVGTDSPCVKLEVSGVDNTDGLVLRDRSGGASEGLNLYWFSGSHISVTDYVAKIQGISSSSATNGDSGELRFFTCLENIPKQQMVIDKSGNVTIGATSTTKKLGVAGTAGYTTVESMGDDDTDFASKGYVDTLAGTSRYTGEKTNRVSIFDAGDGNEGADVIYGGPVKQDRTDGFTLVGSILNGDFSDATGWFAGNATLLVTSNIGTILATAPNSEVWSPPVNVTIGEKWFVATYVKATTALATVSFSGIGGVSHPGSGNYEWLYEVITTTSTGDYVVRFDDNRSSGFDNIYIDGKAGVHAIKMTNMYYEDYTAEEMLDQVRGGYIDGMKSTEDKKISSLDSLGVVGSYNYINAGASLPDGTTDTTVNGVHTQNVSDKTAIATASVINTTNFPLAELNGSFVCLQDDYTLLTGIVDGTITTTDAGDIQYQLATPIISYTHNPNLIAYEGGSIRWENKYEVHETYGTGVDISKNGKYVNVALTQARVYDHETGYETILDIADFTVTSGTATNTSIGVNDLMYFEVEWSDYKISPVSKIIYSRNLTGTIDQLNNTVASQSRVIKDLCSRLERLENI